MTHGPDAPKSVVLSWESGRMLLPPGLLTTGRSMASGAVCEILARRACADAPSESSPGRPARRAATMMALRHLVAVEVEGGRSFLVHIDPLP